MNVIKSLVASLALFALPAQASVVISTAEIGGNVVFDYSGSLNTNSLTFSATDTNPRTLLGPGYGAILAFNNTVNVFLGGTLPSFGSTSIASGVSTGDALAIFSNNVLGVSNTYVSGSAFGGTATFLGSYASLGLVKGTYVSTLSNSETITLNIQAIPVPAAAGLLATALAGLGLLRRRKKS
ncbi:VPLPA-CTERM sorting domain-containing protein [Rhodobacter sp. KR11]|jgi:hypothetical protein|uniref:VPLPA-CTERM sorting domain-containing protein n=1 Tax=Rhodobacter sp. KR11 TaxID=2974588 RepID=UPI002223BC15|nr:VPLPA-CTERM sorting domain-containing protein [Rhodobacter sp. KR11]MCW1920233.1 VPLPA-CTERM sorting domain-containing protein [Rhodobacter sp. KR11]